MTGLRFYKKPVPPNVHPIIKVMFEQANEQQASWKVIADRAGVDESAIAKWGVSRSPRLANIEAVLNVLGYTITVKRKKG